MKWTKINGVRVIQTGSCHTLGRGKTDDVCFENENKAKYIINGLGFIRILSSINKYCQSFHFSKDWENIKRDANTIHPSKTYDTKHKSQHQLDKVQFPHITLQKPLKHI